MKLAVHCCKCGDRWCGICRYRRRLHKSRGCCVRALRQGPDYVTGAPIPLGAGYGECWSSHLV